MITAKELEDNFRRDFDSLLKKHNAEIEITDDRASYGMHVGIAIITIPSKYANDKCERDFCEFNL